MRKTKRYEGEQIEKIADGKANYLGHRTKSVLSKGTLKLSLGLF